MTADIDCLGLGITPLDLLFNIDTMPRPGHKINARSVTVQGGGPIPNVLVGLSRLGYRTALISAFGDDPIGRIGLDQLRAEGVDISHTIVFRGKKSDVASGFIEMQDGRRTLVFSTELQIRPGDLKLSSYPKAKLIHLDGRDVPACARLAEWGRKHRIPVCLDVGSMRNDVSSLLPLVDHLVVADAYALGFTGRRTGLSAARELRKFCNGTIVVTEGLKGSVAIEHRKTYRQAAYKVEAVDATGAGDAFHTGYLHGLLGDAEIDARLKLGAAVAALKCSKHGARAGLPSLRKLKRFLRSNPEVYV